VLMDLRMPRVDGITATRRLRARPRPPEIIVLTTFDTDENILHALRAGASGFLLKDTPPAELLAAIRVVAAGDGLLAPAVTRRLIAEFARTVAPAPVATAGLKGVTDREREVLTLVARGLSNAEIARELVLADATVKTHIGRILAKTGLRDRVALVVLGYETGIVKPSS
jgi:DNA-binding NarL/FixJ family response regulator